jgi:hypothetical protein
MSNRLLALNVLLGAVACLLAAALVREMVTPRPLPPPSTGRGAASRAPAAAQGSASEASKPGPVSPGAYGVIAAKSLFSPARSEGQTGPAVAVGPKPVLHGVIVDGTKSLAFLEDPVAKRTFGYAVGDTIGGGRVQSIRPDRVVIARPDGLVEVLLHDPSKPRPAGPGVGPGTAQAPPAAPPPGTPRPAAMTVPPYVIPGVTVPLPGAPAVAIPGAGVPTPGVPPAANPVPPSPGR